MFYISFLLHLRYSMHHHKYISSFRLGSVRTHMPVLCPTQPPFEDVYSTFSVRPKPSASRTLRMGSQISLV